MNTLKKLMTPPWSALILGIPALILAAVLQFSGLDDRGLFIPGHFAGILIWILTAAMALVTGLSLRQYGGRTKYSRMFPGSTPASTGILGAAVAVLWSAWEIFRTGTGMLESATGLLGLTAAASLVYLAWCRFRGIRGNYLLWCAALAFLMMRLMFSYRTWSAQPELLRYCFALFSSVCVTLAFYYRTAFAVGLGSRRMYLLFTQMGAFFCLIVLGMQPDLFCLGMLLWCLLDIPTLRLFKPKSQEEPV